MSKLFAYATGIVLIFDIYCFIGQYASITWRDISAHLFLWICCEIIYTNTKITKTKGGK